MQGIRKWLVTGMEHRMIIKYFCLIRFLSIFLKVFCFNLTLLKLWGKFSLLTGSSYRMTIIQKILGLMKLAKFHHKPITLSTFNVIKVKYIVYAFKYLEEHWIITAFFLFYEYFCTKSLLLLLLLMLNQFETYSLF